MAGEQNSRRRGNSRRGGIAGGGGNSRRADWPGGNSREDQRGQFPTDGHPPGDALMGGSAREEAWGWRDGGGTKILTIVPSGDPLIEGKTTRSVWGQHTGLGLAVGIAPGPCGGVKPRREPRNGLGVSFTHRLA